MHYEVSTLSDMESAVDKKRALFFTFPVHTAISPDTPKNIAIALHNAGGKNGKYFVYISTLHKCYV